MPFYQMPDGESLHVRIQGKAHAQPVLVLSGLGMQSWQWTPFLFPNFKHYQFIIPDWRGFGQSNNCNIPQDLDAISSHWRDVECLIEQLQLDDFILIGYSMGATTAMHGMQYSNIGQKLKAYLHIDQTPKIATDESWSFGLFGTEYPQFMQLLQSISSLLAQHAGTQYIKDLDPQSRQQLLRMWLKFIKLQGSNRLAPLMFELALRQPKLQKHLLPMQRLDYMAWYIKNYLLHQEDYRQAIAELDCPTTFFIGAQSNLYPAQGQLQIADSLKHTHHVLFQRSGHTPLLSEPLKFTRELQQFLKQAC